jgi:hypothetical protein
MGELYLLRLRKAHGRHARSTQNRGGVHERDCHLGRIYHHMRVGHNETWGGRALIGRTKSMHEGWPGRDQSLSNLGWTRRIQLGTPGVSCL